MARINQKEFYQTNYDKHGISAQGVAWDSVQTQKKRFSVIVSCIGELKQDSIVDAGCGFGDFYLYLKEKGNLPKSYVGLDLCAPMVAEAKVRTGCKIMQKDILHQSIPTADWYVASGSMNLLTQMETRIFIQRCFEKSRKGFVFNLLEGKEREGKFSYWKPYDIRKLCQSMGKKVEIKEGYMDGDMTIMLCS
jgi:SAM-dependent methyltransferase